MVKDEAEKKNKIIIRAKGSSLLALHSIPLVILLFQFFHLFFCEEFKIGPKRRAHIIYRGLLAVEFSLSVIKISAAQYITRTRNVSSFPSVIFFLFSFSLLFFSFSYIFLFHLSSPRPSTYLIFLLVVRVTAFLYQLSLSSCD